MYRKNQPIGVHKTPFGKKHKQGVDSHAPQDIRYTPTPVQDDRGSRVSRFRLESDNRNWMIQDKESHLERHSPDSALTASSNGSSLTFQRGLQMAPKFSRSQSIPNLFEQTPHFPLEHSRRISDSPNGTYRTSSLCKSGPYRDQGPGNVHQGQFVRVRVGPYDDCDAGSRVIESSSLVKNRFKSESNLFDPDVNDPVRRNDKRQAFSVRTVDMKKTLGMFGFVLSCKYVLHDQLVPRELRCFPRIDTVSVEGVAHRSGIRHGHFVLEINRQSVELSSLNRCTSLLQMGGDHLQLKIASNHQTNEPVDTDHRSKGTTGSNFFRDVPSIDTPRRGVRHRESAVKKRLMASHPVAPRMTRANSTPNLADDAQNHIYEELTEPIPEVVAPTPTPQMETGRRGSDVSKTGKHPVVKTPQKPTGRPDMKNKNPGRLDNDKKNAGRSDVERPAISRMTSLNMEGGSGGFPPSPPPRPDPLWGAAIPGKAPMGRGSKPAMKMGGMRGNGVGHDAKPAVVEMKISPGAGITSIASVFGSSLDVSSSEDAPMKFSSFMGPFKDDANSTDVTPPSYDSGRAQQDGGSRVLPTPVSQINVIGMQAGGMGRDRNTPMPRYPDNTSRIVATEESGNKEMFGSRNHLPEVTAPGRGVASRFSGTNGLYVDMEGLTDKSRPVAKSIGDQGGRFEFNSPHHQEKPRTVLTRMGETQGLLEAIMHHPLMRTDRTNSNEQNSTVVSSSHEIIAEHVPQKAPPPIPPPPKSKIQKRAPFEGAVNRYPIPGRSTSPTQECDKHTVALEVKNPGLLKTVNQNHGRNDSNVITAVNHRTQRTGQRPEPSPQTLNTIEKKGDVAANALTRQSPKSNAKQGNKSRRIPPLVDFRNPKQNLRPESHPAQVFHLGGATVDQSYSDDNRILSPAGEGSNELAPLFRFDVSTGKLLLSDATVGDSSTEGDLMPLPPPPPMADFAASGSSSSEIGSQDNPVYSWNKQLKSSNGIASSFNGRSSSIDDDTVFLEGMAATSPPPPVFFIDPDENSGMKSNHDFRSNPIPLPEPHHMTDQEAISRRFGQWTNTSDHHSINDKETIPKRFGPWTNPPDLHPKTDQEAIPRRYRPGIHPPEAVHPTSVPLPPPEFQSISDITPRSNRCPPEPPSKNQWGRPNGPSTREVPSEGGSLSDWSISEVTDWLRRVGLGEHADTFTSHSVDGRRLSSMTRRDLIELGVTEMTQRRDIERGVIRLKSQTGT